jgi:hypothetical protein
MLLLLLLLLFLLLLLLRTTPKVYTSFLTVLLKVDITLPLYISKKFI